jgi:hypothetical protein
MSLLFENRNVPRANVPISNKGHNLKHNIDLESSCNHNTKRKNHNCSCRISDGHNLKHSANKLFGIVLFAQPSKYCVFTPT